MKFHAAHVGISLTLFLLSNGTLVSNALANTANCTIATAPGASLDLAKEQFAESCPGMQRQDCDPVSGNRWMCSTSNIEDSTTVQGPIYQYIPDEENEFIAIPTEDSANLPQISDEACEAGGPTLSEAISAYTLSCPELPREDCDPTDNGQWTCSSNTIGESQPDVVADNIPPVPSEPAPSPADPVPSEPTPTPTDPVPSEPTPTPGEPAPSEPTPAPADPIPSEPTPSTDDEPSGEEIDHTYAKNDGPYKNPLKGWNSGWDGGNDHPESSVGFQYIPWKDFEPSDGNFSRSAVENIIDNEGSKNRHLILRLYCDWHGNDAESDCPGWMYSDAGVARLKGNNGRYITDFNDARYLNQARDAIQALAAAFDNDPRIYAVQMGIIGYWGEWHSWGSSFNGSSYNITDATKNSILDAYRASFTNAKIMARYPWREPTQSAGGIGFHNDYFVANNGHSEEFDTAVATGSQWMDGPIGGEVPPRGGSEANNEKSALFNGSYGEAVIETGHYSTMKAGAYRVNEGEPGYDGYMRLHKKMGYNYQIDLARFSESVNGSEQLSVELIGTNIGVAPMYFDWDVQFALLNDNDNPVVLQESNTELTSILPGALFDFSSEIGLGTVEKGAYRLAVRIIQPNADKPKQQEWKLDARNTYIRFSNDLPVVRGKWNNKKLIGGWSVLGNVAVK